MEFQNDHYILNSPLKKSETLMRIGIVGYGKLGQFLVEKLLTDGFKYRLDLVFIWNRTILSEEVKQKILIRSPLVKILDTLEQIQEFDTLDLIVEVCHPQIVQQYADMFLDKANFLVGSPSALADLEFAAKIKEKLLTCPHRMFVARGALWGANDIQMMARRDRLQSVKITMRFHPRSLRLEDPKIREMNEDLLKGEPRSVILYEGPARELCLLAPNNTNTIATAALLGIGFDQTIGKLIADSSCCDYHRIDVELRGRPTIDGKQFEVELKRKSPTFNSTNVSSLQTFSSFWHSVLQCTDSFTRINSFGVEIC